jgi:hypothetical protein
LAAVEKSTPSDLADATADTGIVVESLAKSKK